MNRSRSDYHDLRTRMCVIAQYCRPCCRPEENFSLSVSPERVARSFEHGLDDPGSTGHD